MLVIAPTAAVLEATPQDYWALLKPRVMSLSIFTAGVGMVLAPGSMHPWLAFVALLAIALGAGAAGALNMWWDADIDARMKRTQGRPLPQGRLLASDACVFGLTLALISVLLLGIASNFYAAGLLALTIFFYSVLYTMILKRWTVQNIVIGGAAGALPPVIGWLAVTPQVSALPILLFLIIFLWTPPHFWALAILTQEEYKRAGVPMMPGVHGIPKTCRQIVVYTLLMTAAAMAPAVMGLVGWVYGVSAGLLSALFLLDVLRLWQDPTLAQARRVFFLSIFYLFLLNLALVADHFMKGVGG